MRQTSPLVLAALVVLAATNACGRGVTECTSAAGFIGLTESEARSLAERQNLRVRVLNDGAVATADLRPDRVNFRLDEGRVAAATRC